MSFFHLVAQAVIEIRLEFFRLALAHLTRTNPLHADLPYIVHMINYLESKSTGAFSSDRH